MYYSNHSQLFSQPKPSLFYKTDLNGFEYLSQHLINVIDEFNFMQCSSFMGTSEREIENEIISFLKSIQILCWKNDSVGIFNPTRKVYMKSHNPHRRRGVADILGVLPNGIFLALEVKAPKGYPTKEQKEFIADINKNGGVAAVVRSVQEVEQLLRTNGLIT